MGAKKVIFVLKKKKTIYIILAWSVQEVIVSVTFSNQRNLILLFKYDDDHGNFHDDEGDKFFCVWNGWQKCIKLYFRTIINVLTTANIGHAISWIWTYVEPKFCLTWMRLFSNGNHYTTTSQASPRN